MILLAFQVLVTETGGQPLSFPTPNILTWTSANLFPDTLITVRVRARNGAGEGEFSNSLSIRTRFGGMLVNVMRY